MKYISIKLNIQSISLQFKPETVHNANDKEHILMNFSTDLPCFALNAMLYKKYRKGTVYQLVLVHVLCSIF